MIIVTPASGLYQVGDRIVAQCVVDTLAGDTLMWSEYQSSPYGSVMFTITPDGATHHHGNYPSRYSILPEQTASGVSYSFVIQSAVLTDGGVYQCGFNKSVDENFPAIITMFG